MAEIVGVVFRGGVKVYHFDPAGIELSRGDRVVVQTMSGPEIGQVVEPPHTIDDSELPAPLKKVVRVATGKDLESQAASEDIRKDALDTCRRLIAEHGLDMKLVGADVGFGGEKITFSFFAEERVDFRALVADLAKTLKMRIELRQVGAREEARMVGGLGPCGRGLCCTLFAGDDEPVSIRMAKEQNLPLNPMKISGLCGRLMCCLKYEQEQYVRFRKEAPAKGTPVSTPGGEGVVAGYNVTKDAIMVRLEDGSSTEVRLCCCQCQEDGLLVFTPEEKEPVPLSWMDAPVGLERLADVEDATEVLPVVEAEVVLGANGEPVEVTLTERSRRGRGRRGRGHRRGKAGSGEAAGITNGAGPTEQAAGHPDGPRGGHAGVHGGSQQKRGQRPGQRSERQHHKTDHSHSGNGGSQEQGEGAPGGSTRSRRRRRRRPGDAGGAPGEPGGNSGE